MKRTKQFLAALAAAAVFALPVAANMASAGATAGEPHKAFVCKYVGKPGVDERLQTGQNPIDVDFSAIGEDPVVVGSYFTDAQGRSFVLAIDVGQDEPPVSDCPGGDTPTDVCPNIDGVQTEVPEGLHLDDYGNCVGDETNPPPVDVCPNIEGNQSEVPDGDVIDEQGNCVPEATNPPPVDVCPNIEGDQATVPEGDVVDNEGNCVPVVTTPPPVPSTPETFIFSSCTDTFIRFEGVGNAYYSVDGVFTDVAITTDPTDIDLGQLANGTVVTSAFNGGDVRTLTVSNDCPTQTPPPPVKACPADQFPCWTPNPTVNWTPNAPIPTHPGVPGSGDLAFTGFAAGDLVPWFIGLGLLGLLALAGGSRLLDARKRAA